jgi:TetR/AcrR family transcriptional repressor of bet genes
MLQVTPRAPGAPPPLRTREEKYDERRNQLAESALATLGELGYARTSLREIAQNSAFSHGVVHYYFANKIELITYCVRYYKATCVTRYDALLATASTAEELATGFADKLVETITDEAPMHRLWYDLRTQSMFEPELREAVLEIDHTLELMIWRIVLRYAELCGGEPVFSSPTTYALFDGLFEKALLSHLCGDPVALDDLRARALTVAGSIVR